MQQPQHGRGAQQADEQQHHTGNGADNGRRVDGLFHVLGVARTVKTRHQQVGKRQRQTDQKDLLGQRAFRQRIRLRLILFFPLSYISLNRARAHRGTASFIRHYATFARWKRQNGAKKKHGTRRGVVFFAENISAQVLTVGGNDLLVPVKTLFLIAVPGAGAVVVAVHVDKAVPLA